MGVFLFHQSLLISVGNGFSHYTLSLQVLKNLQVFAKIEKLFLNSKILQEFCRHVISLAVSYLQNFSSQY